MPTGARLKGDTLKLEVYERDKYNYKTKTIKVEYKREPISNVAINDTTIISFKNYIY